MCCLPLYFRGQLLTAYEVLERAVRRPHAAGRVAAVSGGPQPGRRPAAVPGGDRAAEAGRAAVRLSVVVMGVVSTVYTFVGGMRSVIWNDCISSSVYVARRHCRGLCHRQPDFRRLGAKCCDLPAETGKLQMFDFRLSLDRALHVLGRPDRRRGADHRHARHRPLDGAALSERPQPGRCRPGHSWPAASSCSCSSPCSCSSASSWRATSASIRSSWS